MEMAAGVASFKRSVTWSITLSICTGILRAALEPLWAVLLAIVDADSREREIPIFTP